MPKMIDQSQYHKFTVNDTDDFEDQVQSYKLSEISEIAICHLCKGNCSYEKVLYVFFSLFHTFKRFTYTTHINCMSGE